MNDTAAPAPSAAESAPTAHPGGASIHEPYIAASKDIPELTIRAVVLGAILGVIFAASLFRHLADLLPAADNFPRLRAIRLGSDTVQKADVELYRRRFAP